MKLKFIDFIPSFRKKNIISKLFISLFLTIISCGILYSQFNPYVAFVRDALLYDPYKHALDLYHQTKLAKAYDFIDFYQSIPNIEENKKLDELKHKIEDERKSVSYIAAEVWHGLIGNESEEDYAKAVEFITEFIAIGDARALYAEAEKYIEGKEVDTLNASLASLGLVLSAVKYGPQIAAIAPIKSATSFFRKSLIAMNSKLKKAVYAAFNPILEIITKFKNEKSIRLTQDVVKVFEMCSGKFKKILHLASKDSKAAMLVVSYSDDVAQLSKNAQLATDIGKDASKILMHGGKISLTAAEKLQKNGKLSGDTIKGFMRFGPNGLKAIGKIPLEKLISKVRLVRISTSAKVFYYIEWLFSLIPKSIAFIIILYSVMTLLKSWIPCKTNA